MEIVGLWIVGNAGVRSIVAVGSKVVDGGVAGGQGRSLAIAEVACEGFRAGTEGGMGVLVIRGGAGV